MEELFVLRDFFLIYSNKSRRRSPSLLKGILLKIDFLINKIRKNQPIAEKVFCCNFGDFTFLVVVVEPGILAGLRCVNES